MKKNGKLKDSLCYLIGGIDYCPDAGKSWRKDIIHQCNVVNDLGIKFLDPTNKVEGLTEEVDSEQKYINRLKKLEKWDELKSFMKKVVRSDHKSIDFSDFIVVYIDVDNHMCGSYFELQSALTEKKPYFIIVKGGKANTPNWLFGILDHQYILPDVKSVVAELKGISSGTIETSDRWVLIREQIKEL